MSSNKGSIQLQKVSKLFYKQEHYTLKEMLPALLTGHKTANQFWALRQVDLEINPGETIGILGPNGSGKSTMLKLIAGVTEPTEGTVKVTGRIAPLIELGAGFHPELTGRENIFLNGVILGMTKEEVKKKYQTIVDFAELEEFIDQPVKHYSSGMYLRLAFAVAIHTDPDILLIDEILAVGDEKFQKKCFGKLEQLKQNGATIVLVSHAVETIENFCDSAVYLEQGKIKGNNNLKQALEMYQNYAE